MVAWRSGRALCSSLAVHAVMRASSIAWRKSCSVAGSETPPDFSSRSKARSSVVKARSREMRGKPDSPILPDSALFLGSPIFPDSALFGSAISSGSAPVSRPALFLAYFDAHQLWIAACFCMNMDYQQGLHMAMPGWPLSNQRSCSMTASTRLWKFGFCVCACRWRVWGWALAPAQAMPQMAQVFPVLAASASA
jgi:hypothetical protein